MFKVGDVVECIKDDTDCNCEILVVKGQSLTIKALYKEIFTATLNGVDFYGYLSYFKLKKGFISTHVRPVDYTDPAKRHLCQWVAA